LPRSEQCQNCGEPAAAYCGACGQRNYDHRVPFWQLLGEFIVEIVDLDSRVARTLVTLVRRPGRLTREWAQGRRTAYSSPIKLYLATSFLYFFVAGLVVTYRPLPNNVKVEFGSEISKPQPTSGRLERRLFEHVQALNQLAPEVRVRTVIQRLLEHLPQVMFVLVPVFALLLLPIYRGHPYVEHLIFALHVHAFAFVIALARLPLPSWAGLVGFLVLPVYVVVALRDTYGGSWARTIGKGLALLMLYSILLGFGIGAAFMLALLL
jgi:hypothetical protein